MCERQSSVDKSGVGVGVVSAANKLIEAKGAAPGSEHHKRTLVDLTDLVGKNPQALEQLRGLQNNR